MRINLRLFGGRGGGASGGRGGSTGANANAAAAPAVDENGIPTTLTADSLNTFFETATPEQADALLDKLRHIPQGEGEQHSDTQRFMNAIGWTEREPVVYNETQYQAEYAKAGRPQQWYHSDKPEGGHTAKEFATQYMGGAYDFAGDKMKQYLSGGVYGDGTYFANGAVDASFYGTNQFRGFLNGNAKQADYLTLRREMQTYEASHPGFRHFINSATTGYSPRSGGDREGLVSVFAAMKGYNVIFDGYGYISVLDRSVTTVSSKQRSTRSMRGDW